MPPKIIIVNTHSTVHTDRNIVGNSADYNQGPAAAVGHAMPFNCCCRAAECEMYDHQCTCAYLDSTPSTWNVDYYGLS